MLEEKILKGAADQGIQLDENAAALYLKYMDLLLEWNQKVNLTAITEPEDIITKHFLDSISILPYIKKKYQIFNMLDVGTGAGFPGVPVKIADPEINVVLLDSLNKRINFLNTLINELGLQAITAVHGRAEDFAQKPEFREKFDLVVSRAVAKLSVLSELCLPFVKVGGIFVSYKGPKAPEEMEEAKQAVGLLGGKIVDCSEISLPGEDGQRNLIIIEKIKSTPAKFPRKAGMPERKPL